MAPRHSRSGAGRSITVERALRSHPTEQIGILPEASCPRVQRLPAENWMKPNYGNEVQIDSPKILRRSIRILDIAPCRAVH